MATTPTQAPFLENSPFTLFTVLAYYCERFVDTLMESDNLGERRAFCYHLAGCLNLLYPTLNDPIPPHLIENLTVDQLPDTATALA